MSASTLMWIQVIAAVIRLLKSEEDVTENDVTEIVELLPDNVQEKITDEESNILDILEVFKFVGNIFGN